MMRQLAAALTAIGMSSCFVGSVCVADEPNSPRTLVELRIVQLNAKAAQLTPGGPAHAGAVKPDMILDPNTGATVYYVAPRGKDLLLGEQVLPASRGRVGASRGVPAGKADADGAKAPEEEPPWIELNAPSIVCHVGQLSAIEVGAKVPYMVKRPDGTFVLEQGEPEGLHVELLVGEATASGVRIDQLEVKLSQVVGREPIADVPFDVGRPRYRTRQQRMALRIAPDKVAIVPLPVEPEQVYILVAARRVQPQP